ncbi:unnamed protein product, partial [Didymodactylos carnosus]
GQPGTRGGDGGIGSDVGLGGFGGYAAVIHIEENQNLIAETFSKIIESKDKSNISGGDGSPGEGGKGGTGGYDGTDVLYHKYHSFTRNKKYEGHIEILKIKKTLFTLDVKFVFKKKSKKRDGIDNINGKSADLQLRSGKVRNKREEKETFNEQQIKGQLNAVINNNNEETNNTSNNITSSMNLLKDQMIEILDERESKIKTHQLSNSFIENSYKIVQQSLVLNE